jgi:hypothetical protein
MAMDVQAALNTYADLMTQIKSRQNILADVAENQRRYPDWAVVELVQFQIRMICETFAIACLVAHGDIPSTRSGKLADAYQADFIMNRLEDLHRDFYPRPSSQKFKDGALVGWEELSDLSGCLTKPELLRSYRLSSNYLHAVNVQDVLARKQRTYDMRDAVAWVGKLVLLLNHHNIYLADDPVPGEKPLLKKDGTPAPKRQIVTLMNSNSTNDVSVLLMRRADTLGIPQEAWPSPPRPTDDQKGQ